MPASVQAAFISAPEDPCSATAKFTGCCDSVMQPRNCPGTLGLACIAIHAVVTMSKLNCLSMTWQLLRIPAICFNGKYSNNAELHDQQFVDDT